MYIRVHELAKGIINHSMPGNPVLSIKLIGHYSYIKVPLSFLCTFVAGVQVTLVFDQQFSWGKRLAQQLLNRFDAIRAHRAQASGSESAPSSWSDTVTIQTDWITRKTIVSPSNPKSLNLTHVGSLNVYAT